MSCGAHSEYETLVCMGISLHVALTLGVLLGIGYVCLDVGSMSRYRICIQLKSTFGSGPDYMRKKVKIFVFTHVQQIPIGVRWSKKILFVPV